MSRRTSMILGKFRRKRVQQYAIIFFLLCFIGDVSKAIEQLIVLDSAFIKQLSALLVLMSARQIYFRGRPLIAFLVGAWGVLMLAGLLDLVTAQQYPVHEIALFAFVVFVSFQCVELSAIKNATELAFVIIGLMAWVLFIYPEYYAIFDPAFGDRPAFSYIRAGGPMLSSNELPLSMVLLLALLRICGRRIKFFHLLILVGTVGISQSRAGALGAIILIGAVLAEALRESGLRKRMTYIALVTCVALPFSQLIGSVEDLLPYEIAQVSRLIGGGDTAESTNARYEAAREALTLENMTILWRDADQTDELYKITPHVTPLAILAKYGFLVAVLSLFFLVGFVGYLWLEVSKLSCALLALFFVTEPFIYAMPIYIYFVAVIVRQDIRLRNRLKSDCASMSSIMP